MQAGGNFEIGLIKRREGVSGREGHNPLIQAEGGRGKRGERSTTGRALEWRERRGELPLSQVAREKWPRGCETDDPLAKDLPHIWSGELFALACCHTGC